VTAYARRQVAVDGGHLLVHRLRHGAAVLADQHEDGAQHHFAAVLGGGAGAQFAPSATSATSRTRGTPPTLRSTMLRDVFQRAHLARRADQQLLAARSM
jgi:hypothetical protein